MNKIKEYALAVVAFVEQFTQAMAAFFGKRISPLFKPLKPVGDFFKRIFKPVFDFLKTRPVLTVVVIGFMYFIGIASVLYPLVGNIYSLEHSQFAVEEYEKAVNEMTKEEIDKRFSNAQIYNTDLANGIYNDGYERSLNSVDNLMCFVEVPSVNIYLPVYYGTSDAVLAKGCGWLENTSLPVEGKTVHSVISGHTGLPNAEMFTKLDQVKTGEVFYIHVLNKIYAYKVDNIVAVTPDRTYLLNVIPDKDYCTLLTCTPYGINDKRLLVRGERIPYSAPQEEVIESKNVKSSVNDFDEELEEQIQHQYTIIIGIAVVAVVVYIFACVWLFRAVKREPVETFDLMEDDDTEEHNGEES